MCRWRGEGPTYKEAAVGTREDDVVQMTSMCVKVLTGEMAAENPKKISRRVAVVLLAHYVGDLHQPLHVGAAYFDAKGMPTVPRKGETYFADKGGNAIAAVIGGKEVANLHTYWDVDLVGKAFDVKGRQVNEGAIAAMVKEEPVGWKPKDGSVPVQWAEMWADEILPVAKEAHDRLRFEETEGSKLKFKAVEADGGMKMQYEQWAAGVVKEEVHRAGWRLAYLLGEVVK